MLQAMRDKMSGWLAYFIIALISVPFALWGVHEYVGGGREPAAASVNGDEISLRAFENQFRGVRERLATQYNGDIPAEVEAEAKNRTLDSLINQRLIDQYAEEAGLHISNESVLKNIREMDLFHVNGQFDKTKYEEEIALRGLSHEQIKNNVGNSMRVNQVRSLLSDSNFMTPSQIEATYLSQNQTRDVSYRVLKSTDYADKITVDDVGVQGYYNTHKAKHYSTPERVKLAYIDLSVDALANNITPTDDQIDEAYQAYLVENKDDDIRTASHILVRAKQGDEAEEKVAFEKITAIKARVDGGEDFATVAKEASEDTGSARNGGALGDVRKGQMVAPFEAALFAMEAGMISEPVQSRFGYHIISLAKITPAAKPFEEVKEKLTEDAKRAQAQVEFDELSENVANAAYENEGSLDAAADVFGGEVQESDWVTRKKADGVLNHPKVFAAAFSEAVINDGINSEPVNVGDGRMLVLRAQAHEPAAAKPFEEVKEKVSKDFKQSEQKVAAEEDAKAVVESAKIGGDALAALSAEGEVQRSEKLKRTSSIEKLARSVTNKAFSTPEGQANYQVLPNGDVVVLAVEKVHTPETTANEENKPAIETRLRRQMQGDAFSRLMKFLGESGEIVRYELP